MAADELAGSIFANGARIGGALTVDQVLDPEQRIQVRENIVEPMTGSRNAGGVIVLEAGMKFVPMSMTPEDSQFLETRSFHVEEQCRWFRMPPGLIGHTEKASSLPTAWEGQMISFLTLTLRPYLQRIEQAISRSLLTATQRLTLKPEFLVEGLLRADSAARASFYNIMVQNGLMTHNEARRKENLPPLPGGDVLTVQSQNVPLGQMIVPKPVGT
jgi:HK97 family phage portal protein